jgi:hypothetical protein
MAILTREQKSAEIMRLEIEASKIQQQAGGGGSIYGSNLFPKYLKIMRKIQKLRDSLWP